MTLTTEVRQDFRSQRQIVGERKEQMLHIVFEYMDAYTHGEWQEQECYVHSVAECKKIYGLGIDCEYRILKVEEA